MNNKSIEAIRQLVEMELGEQVTVQESLKNNGLKLTGLAIGSDKIRPILYIKDFIPEDDKDRIVKEAKRIITAYRNLPENPVIAEISKETILNTAFPVAINYERNKELLESLPHERVFDLAKAYRFEAGKDRTAWISNAMMKAYGIDMAELFAIKGDYIAQSINAVLTEHEEIPEGKRMLVVSNKDKHYGAGAIFRRDILHQIATEWDTDLSIMPSSIHEIIVIPLIDADDANEMVAAVNSEVLEDSDFLANHAYKYIRGEGIKEV